MNRKYLIDAYSDKDDSVRTKGLKEQYIAKVVPEHDEPELFWWLVVAGLFVGVGLLFVGGVS